MTGVRLTACTLCFVLVAAGLAAGQKQNRLTPTTAALRLQASQGKDSYDFERATQAIGSSYWKRGDYEAAFAQIENLEPTQKIDQLFSFVSQAIKSGHIEPARSALNCALKVIASEDEDSRDAGGIRDFAKRALELGDLELASRFSAELDEGSARKALTLVALAEAWAKRGEKDKAIALFDQGMKQAGSFDEEEQGSLLGLLTTGVNVFVILGEKERAAKLANQANEFLQSRGKPDDVDTIQVAGSFARLGDFPRAMLLAESLDDEDKAESLLSLANEYHARGDETAALSSLLQARAILESTGDEDSRSASRDIVARGYLDLGRLDDAFDVMRGIRNNFDLQRLAIDLAGSFAEKNRRQDASAALDFAYSQIRRVVSEKSEDIPNMASTSKAREKSSGLSRLGEKYLEIGDLRGAEAAANAIDHPQYKASLLAAAAVAYAKNGDQSKAKSLLAEAFKLSSKAEPYSHDEWRESALMKIAESYADAGFKQESANVIMRLLRELRDGDKDNLAIDFLMEVGLMAETKGVSLNRDSQKLLKQVIEKAEE